MSGRGMTYTVDLAMRQWAPRVSEAALAFEARWTKFALRNLDAKIADAFEKAAADFATAMTEGTATQVSESGGRLCRAYGVIAAKLDAANVPDDAYMVGRDPNGGTKIVIAVSPAAGARARKLHGCDVWFTPDEIASLLFRDEVVRKVMEAKAAFPGAEITSLKTAGAQ